MGMWQRIAIDDLSSLFRKDAEVKALVLTGSLANGSVEPDEWSDVDLKIVLSRPALGRYYSSSDWLESFGEVLAEDRVEHGCTKTLRVCLRPFRRLDLTFVPEPDLEDAGNWEYNPFPGPYTVVWSRIPELERHIADIPPPAFQDGGEGELDRIQEEFWFKAMIAIAKAVRNDLLVALHLALDLVRDCLVLQMLLRDRTERTTIHRKGGWGNEIVGDLCTGCRQYSSEEILQIVETACTCFDDLAGSLSESYRPRAAQLIPAVKRAQKGVVREMQRGKRKPNCGSMRECEGPRG